MRFLPFTPRTSPIVFYLLLGLHTNPLVAPTIAIAQNMSIAPLLISWQNSILFVLAIYLYL